MTDLFENHIVGFHTCDEDEVETREIFLSCQGDFLENV